HRPARRAAPRRRQVDVCRHQSGDDRARRSHRRRRARSRTGREHPAQRPAGVGDGRHARRLSYEPGADLARRTSDRGRASRAHRARDDPDDRDRAHRGDRRRGRDALRNRRARRRDQHHHERRREPAAPAARFRRRRLARRARDRLRERRLLLRAARVGEHLFVAGDRAGAGRNERERRLRDDQRARGEALRARRAARRRGRRSRAEPRRRFRRLRVPAGVDARVTLALDRAQSTTTLDLSGTRKTFLYTFDPDDPAYAAGNLFGGTTQYESEGRAQLSLRDVIESASSTLVAGIDLARGSGRIDDGISPASLPFAQTAAYAQETLVTPSGIRTELGLRGERDGAYGGIVAPSLGVRVPLGADLDVRANAATGFRAPDLTELIYPTYSNPN